MTDTVQAIKERIQIDALVGEYIKLKRAGAVYKALCPFHSEKTPSFVVSPERESFHCFGCGVGGDIFTFVEMIEGVDFKGAMKILAEKAGVEIVYTKKNSEDKDKKNTLFNIMETATTFYEKKLFENNEAINYLEKRGVDTGLIKRFRIGFAPDSWDVMLNHLTNAGFDKEDIEKVGLIKKKEGNNSYYDRFRNRIIFPIEDSARRVVAFSGRIMPGSDIKKNAKYLNSPETPLFHKSKILYGYSMAKQFIRKYDFAILVEGQMDLVMSHKSGFPNTVAISGTALTQEHLGLLARMSKNLILALDADEAGIRSALKSSKLALSSGFDVKLLKYGEGKDPADIILNDGVKVWKKTVKEAVPAIDYFIDYFKSISSDELKFKKQIKSFVLPLLASINSDIIKEHFIESISNKTFLSTEAIKSELDSVFDADINQGMNNKGVKVKKFGPCQKLVLIHMWKNDPNLKAELEKIFSKEKLIDMIKKLESVKDIFFEFDEIYANQAKLDFDVKEFKNKCALSVYKKELSEITKDIDNSENEEALLERQKELIKLIAQLSSQ